MNRHHKHADVCLIFCLKSPRSQTSKRCTTSAWTERRDRSRAHKVTEVCIADETVGIRDSRLPPWVTQSNKGKDNLQCRVCRSTVKSLLHVCVFPLTCWCTTLCPGPETRFYTWLPFTSHLVCPLVLSASLPTRGICVGWTWDDILNMNLFTSQVQFELILLLLLLLLLQHFTSAALYICYSTNHKQMLYFLFH